MGTKHVALGYLGVAPGSGEEQGPVEGPDVVFRLAVGTDGSCMPAPWCCAQTSWFALSNPHSLPAPPFPEVPHLPFLETSCSLQLSCSRETTPWLGLLCRKLSRSSSVENSRYFQCSEDKICVWRGRGRFQGS